MIGRRVRLAEGQDPLPLLTQPGDYAFPVHGRLYMRDPIGGICSISPDIHSITEHEDGTITVSPSIRRFAYSEAPEWHGYLERGIWRTV